MIEKKLAKMTLFTSFLMMVILMVIINSKTVDSQGLNNYTFPTPNATSIRVKGPRKHLNETQKQAALKKLFLRLLHISESEDNVSVTSETPPEILVALYNWKRTGYDPQFQQIYYKSKLVRAFLEEKTEPGPRDIYLFCDEKICRNSNGNYEVVGRYDFKLDGLTLEDREKIIHAELHLHNIKNTCHTYTFASNTNYTIKLYQILPGKDEYYIPSHRLVNEYQSQDYNDRYHIFNVTKTVKEWINDTQSNRGLYVLAEIDPLAFQCSMRPFVRRTVGSSEKQPLLLLFTDDNYEGSGRCNGCLEKVDHGLSIPELLYENLKSGDEKAELPPKQILNTTLDRVETKPCAKRDLIIDFDEIGLNSVIAPRSFNAYQCRGHCRSKVESGTFYATVQDTHVNNTTGFKRSDMCCAPRGLSSIHVFTWDGKNQYVLRKLPDMVLGACSCQSNANN